MLHSIHTAHSTQPRRAPSTARPPSAGTPRAAPAPSTRGSSGPGVPRAAIASGPSSGWRGHRTTHPGASHRVCTWNPRALSHSDLASRNRKLRELRRQAAGHDICHVQERHSSARDLVAVARSLFATRRAWIAPVAHEGNSGAHSGRSSQERRAWRCHMVRDRRGRRAGKTAIGRSAQPCTMKEHARMHVVPAGRSCAGRTAMTCLARHA